MVNCNRQFNNGRRSYFVVTLLLRRKENSNDEKNDLCRFPGSSGAGGNLGLSGNGELNTVAHGVEPSGEQNDGHQHGQGQPGRKAPVAPMFPSFVPVFTL